MATPITIPGFGWHPPLPDPRNLMLADAVDLGAVAVPRAVDLSGDNPPVRNQGELGSCTAFGTTNLYMTIAKKTGFYSIQASPLFVYYETRVLQGTVSYDSGASVMLALKSLVQTGASTEESWPYDVSKFRKKPTSRAINAGKRRQALQYMAVRNDELFSTIAAGFPVAIGFSVFQSFVSAEVDRTGLVPLPKPGESIIGGHCVLVTGYDLDAEYPFKFLNSYGPRWGVNGYGRMKREYLENPQLAGDYWTIRTVEG